MKNITIYIMVKTLNVYISIIHRTKDDRRHTRYIRFRFHKVFLGSFSSVYINIRKRFSLIKFNFWIAIFFSALSLDYILLMMCFYVNPISRLKLIKLAAWLIKEENISLNVMIDLFSIIKNIYINYLFYFKKDDSFLLFCMHTCLLEVMHDLYILFCYYSKCVKNRW